MIKHTSFIHLFIYLFVYLFIYLFCDVFFIYVFVYLFLCLCVYFRGGVLVDIVVVGWPSGGAGHLFLVATHWLGIKKMHILNFKLVYRPHLYSLGRSYILWNVPFNICS